MKTSISETTLGSIAVFPIPSSRNRFIVNERRVFQCGKGAHSIPTEIEAKEIGKIDSQVCSQPSPGTFRTLGRHSFGTFQGNSYYSHIILFGHTCTRSSHMSPSRGTCLAMCSMNVRCNTLCQTTNTPQNGNLLDSSMIWTKIFATSHKQNAYLPIRPCSLKTLIGHNSGFYINLKRLKYSKSRYLDHVIYIHV